jgi:hypothetical protein
MRVRLPYQSEPWFTDFVHQVRDEWRRQQRKRNNPSIREASQRMPSADESWRLAEAHLVHIATMESWLAAQTPNSETPGDVLTLSETEDAIVLAAFQVKSSHTSPKQLTQDERLECDRFSGFMFESFRESDLVPPRYQRAPLISSVGYSSVLVYNDTTEVSESYALALMHSREISKDLACKHANDHFEFAAGSLVKWIYKGRFWAPSD